MIDGASRFNSFRKVVLPISRPSLASAACPTAPGPSFSAAGPPRDRPMFGLRPTAHERTRARLKPVHQIVIEAANEQRGHSIFSGM